MQHFAYQSAGHPDATLGHVYAFGKLPASVVFPEQTVLAAVDQGKVQCLHQPAAASRCLAHALSVLKAECVICQTMQASTLLWAFCILSKHAICKGRKHVPCSGLSASCQSMLSAKGASMYLVQGILHLVKVRPLVEVTG